MFNCQAPIQALNSAVFDTIKCLAQSVSICNLQYLVAYLYTMYTMLPPAPLCPRPSDDICSINRTIHGIETKTGTIHGIETKTGHVNVLSGHLPRRKGFDDFMEYKLLIVSCTNVSSSLSL